MDREQTFANFLETIAKAHAGGNVSSAIRVEILNHFIERASENPEAVPPTSE